MATENVKKVEISKNDWFSDPHVVPIDASLILIQVLVCASTLQPLPSLTTAECSHVECQYLFLNLRCRRQLLCVIKSPAPVQLKHSTTVIN